MRTNNWPDKLNLFVEEKRNQPFNWRLNNCGFFACDWVAMLIGVDPAAAWRTLTARQLVVFVRDNTLSDLANRCAQANNFQQVEPAFVRRGDTVESPPMPEAGPALGVCLGFKSVFPGKKGIVFINTLVCTRGWRID